MHANVWWLRECSLGRHVQLGIFNFPGIYNNIAHSVKAHTCEFHIHAVFSTLHIHVQNVCKGVYMKFSFDFASVKNCQVNNQNKRWQHIALTHIAGMSAFIFLLNITTFWMVHWRPKKKTCKVSFRCFMWLMWETITSALSYFFRDNLNAVHGFILLA